MEVGTGRGSISDCRSILGNFCETTHRRPRSRCEDLRVSVVSSRSVQSGDGWCSDASNTHRFKAMQAFRHQSRLTLCCELRTYGRDMQVGHCQVGHSR